MPQSLIITLLLFAFVLPILGAVVLRLLAPRLAPVQLYSAAVLLLGVVIASVLVLARSEAQAGRRLSRKQPMDLSSGVASASASVASASVVTIGRPSASPAIALPRRQLTPSV